MRDAGADAAMDAALDPDDPAWEHVSGLPPTCVIEHARRPEVLYPDPTWSPCPMEACDQFVPEEHYPFAFGTWGGHDGDRGYFNQVVEFHGRQVDVLRSSDLSPALAAWRQQPFDGSVCLVLQGYHGADIVVAIAQEDEVRLYRSAAVDARLLGEPLVVLDRETLRGSFPQHIVVGDDDLIALEMQPGAFVLLVDGGEAHMQPGLLGPLSGAVQGIQVVGSHVLWQEWGDHVRVAHRAASGVTEVFLEIPDGDVKGFTADEDNMAWLLAHNRAADGTYERIELWTSPHAAMPEELEPRMVAELDRNVAEAFMCGGWWGFMRSLDPVQINHWQLVLYRLADGQLRRFDFPLGYAVNAEIAWLTSTELATSARGIFNENQFFRVQIDQMTVE